MNVASQDPSELKDHKAKEDSLVKLEPQAPPEGMVLQANVASKVIAVIEDQSVPVVQLELRDPQDLPDQRVVK